MRNRLYNNFPIILTSSALSRLLQRIGILFLLYTIMRLIFLVYNRDMLHIHGLGDIAYACYGGMQFDASAIIYTNLLFILLSILPFRLRSHHIYQKVCKWIFLITNSLAIVVNMADVVYFRYTLKRTTASIFKEFGHENAWNFGRMFLDFWPVTLLGIALIVLLYLFYRKTMRCQEDYDTQHPWRYYLINILWIPIVALLCVGGIRGGWAHSVRPITLSNASAYINEPQQRALVLNTPFCLIRTIDMTVLTPINTFTDDEVEKIYPVSQSFPDSTATNYARFEGRNVVLIIWESFSREWVGSLNKDVPNYPGFTPFIDSLSNHALVFDNAYANGRKSIDAIPSIMTSIPRYGESFVLSHYSGNTLNSLPSLLKKQGYHSAFFHGAHNGSMGFDAFTHQIGFDRYYGATEYNNSADYDGIWGIWDRPFLQYMSHQLDTLRQPFFASVFTLSSHHPYKVEPGYEHKYPQGQIPIHPCIGYTDDALRQFFHTASQSPWYKQTLFVIVADHAVPGVLKNYTTTAGLYRIPIIIYDPQEELVGIEHTTAQQIDIMPTLLNLLGYQGKAITFGQDILNPSRTHVAVMNNEDATQMIWDNYLLIYQNKKASALYNLLNDPLQQRNILNDEPQRRQAMKKLTEAFIQQYNNRLINNNLTVKNE